MRAFFIYTNIIGEIMFLLKTSASFDSAHFLCGYNGKCANIHGHTWRVEVAVGDEKLVESGEKRGMVIDFSDLKKSEGFSLKEVPFRPTAENFARHFYKALAEKLPVRRVTVYETPDNCAEYEED